MDQPIANTSPSWRRPRPPLHRLCTVHSACDDWPDRGRGVWETYGYADLDTKSERVQMRRVMPAVAGGSTGELIWVYRSTFELGLVAVWRAGGDLIDPDFAEDARRRSGWNAVAQTSAPMQVLDLADLTRRLIDALAAPEPNAPVLDAARRYLARHGLLEAPTSGHTSSIWQSVPDRSVAPSNESHAE